MIRLRLTIWNCAVLAFVLTLTGLAIYLTARQAVLQAIDDGLIQRARTMSLMSSNMRFGGGPGSPGSSFQRDHDNDKGENGGNKANSPNEPRMGPPQDWKMSVEEAKAEGIDPQQLKQLEAMRNILRPMILNFDGTDAVRPENKAWDTETIKQARLGQDTFVTLEREGIKIRVLSAPIRKDGKITNILQLAAPMVYEEQQLHQLTRTLVIVLPLAVVVMMIIGVLLTRQALRPVGQIADAAEQIEASNLSDRLPVQGKDEFAQLSTTFNGMLERLQKAFDQIDRAYARQRRFTADASHELKTPLTAIKARTGIALMKDHQPEQYKDHLRAIDRSAELMSTIVHDLLLLSASDEGQLTLRKEQVNLQDLVADAIDSVDASGHTMTVSLGSDANVYVDPSAITRVLVNIIQNSLLYSPSGTEISIKCLPAGNDWKLVIADQGEGIPDEDIPMIFERFHRVDKSRDRHSGGSGLGLAIAKAIVEAHGGEISLDSKLGTGTTVSIVLPISNEEGTARG